MDIDAFCKRILKSDKNFCDFLDCFIYHNKTIDNSYNSTLQRDFFKITYMSL